MVGERSCPLWRRNKGGNGRKTVESLVRYRIKHKGDFILADRAMVVWWRSRLERSSSHRHATNENSPVCRILPAAALTLRCLLKAGLLCQVRLYVFRLLGRSMDTDA